MNNKKGWIRIMEATIAVLIVSGSLLVIYSRQIDRGISPAEYFNSLEGQILADVSTKSDLRLAVLNVFDDENEDDENDPNFVNLNQFVATKIPEAFGYSLQVCELSDTADHCNMDYAYVVVTRDKDIFTEEIMIAADLGSGGSDAIQKPKKVKLYVWEGDVEVGCADDTGCYGVGTTWSCSADGAKVMSITCEDINGDGCLEAGAETIYENCAAGEVCDYSTSVAKCTDNKAVLDLMFSDVVYSWVDGYHIYTHTRTFQETNGVGVTLTEGQLCYQSTGSCDAKGVVNYRIEGYNKLIHTDKRFGTPSTSDKFTLKYWGVDDNGFNIYVEETLCVDGSSFTIGC